MSISLILDGMSDKASNILKHITKMSYETGIYIMLCVHIWKMVMQEA